VTTTFAAVASQAKRHGLTLSKGMASWDETIYGLWTRDGHIVAPELFYLDEIAAYLEVEYEKVSA
jgi:hypothetical protein